MTRRGALIDQDSLNEELQTAFSELDTLDWHTACGDEVRRSNNGPRMSTMTRWSGPSTPSPSHSGTSLF
ncbi:hypothetical protein LshimejAT787_0901410 [Lyophyllum shimeji]|uniref:Uncharacterized protein n=1 Tax=Lyophyllum shimeji TaxID=47721 RepID=A0A9P3PSI0_LYOSH|nr:hypothetical protein LshimejAT787_0901410 [Lyophyllum shimeji]